MSLSCTSCILTTVDSTDRMLDGVVETLFGPC